LLGVPLVSFVVSHATASIFSPRYFIPASLGLAPGVAYLVAWSRRGNEAILSPEAPPTSDNALATTVWTVIVALLAIPPMLHAEHAPPKKPLGAAVEAVAPLNAFIVVESILDLLPLRHYQRRHDLTYVYPMDWNAATVASELYATVEYKQMAIWKRVGYADSTMLSGTHVPCNKPQFVVLNSLQNAWFDDRIVPDSNFTYKEVGHSHPPLHHFVIYAVERRGDSIPVTCHTNTSSASTTASAAARDHRGSSF